MYAILMVIEFFCCHPSLFGKSIHSWLETIQIMNYLHIFLMYCTMVEICYMTDDCGLYTVTGGREDWDEGFLWELR